MQNGHSDAGIVEESSVEILSRCYLNPACDVTESPVWEGNQPVNSAVIQNGQSTTPVLKNGDAEFPDDSSPKKRRPLFFEDRDIVLRVCDVVCNKGYFVDVVNYTIEVFHAGYYWTIYRNYGQIHALHINLFFFEESLRLKNDDRAFTGQPKNECANADHLLPVFPDRCPANPTAEQKAEHTYQMENYLGDLFHDRTRREQVAALRFLEVSRFSFIDGPQTDREKDTEAAVQKLNCGLHEFCFLQCSHNNMACKMFSRWKERWIIIRETCYIYMNTKTGVIGGVFLLDQHMEIDHLSSRKTSLLIKHAMQDLIIRFQNRIEMDFWQSRMNIALQRTALQFTAPQPHGSFSPVRENVPAKFFINGAPFMEAVADAMENAKEEIFIGGWWVSPDVFLKRPIKDGTRWRLDHILKRKAEEGVKIYILMYKESRVALGINSFYTKKKLTRLHPNILVQRHPDKNVLLWSHHEKMVVVDQKLAFVGGIDLCYGRWDDHHHRLNDLTKEMLEHGEGDTGASVGKYGKDLNQRHVSKPKPKPAVRKERKRDAFSNVAMAPWRGVRARMNVPRFRPRTRFDYRMRRYRRSFLGKIASRFRKFFRLRPVEEKDNNDDTESQLEKLSELAKECLWLGKDYCNEVKYAFAQPDKGDPYEDLLDRKDTPRLPWHDASACVWGVAARDTGRHFIQKWNACKKFRFDEGYPFLIPKLYKDFEMDDFVPADAYSCRVQVLRNTASWSAGLLPDVVEYSIQQAYIDLIEKSKHYVYIESQFFITLVGSKKVVKNRIGDALFHRIERAFKNNENFRLYITLPLQPAIAGAYGTRAGAAVQAVTHWIYQSLSQGKHCLIGNLRRIGADPSKYLTVCGLRQHDEILGKLATELVYVHSKLIVVDDVFTVIASANLNDRSMLGKRDSEIGLIVEDTQFEDSVMDGKPYRSGLFSGRLRKQLMKISLGLLEDMPHGIPAEEGDLIVQDPVCEEFYRHVWIKTAVKNEAIFEEVFACVPTDKVFKFSQLKDYEKQKTLNETDPQKARELLDGVRGYLTKFPLKFLKDSKLLPAYSTAAGLLPAINWT